MGYSCLRTIHHTAADRLEQPAQDQAGKDLLPAAVRWILDRGVEIAIWGGRRPNQMAPIPDVFDWKTDESLQFEVDAIVDETIKDPVGPQFMAPPARES